MVVHNGVIENYQELRKALTDGTMGGKHIFVSQTDTELTLPHPRIIERSFVLLPLLEIAPDFFLPNWGELKAYLPKVAHQSIEKLSCRNCGCTEKDAYQQAAH